MFYKLILVDTIHGVDQSDWVLKLPSTIGRDPDHEVSINHDSISRTHCRLSLNGEGALVVRDLNSMNGTYIEDKKITQSVLMPDETLQLGSVTLRIEYTTDTELEQPRRKPREYDLSVTTPMNLSSHFAGDEDEQEKKWWQFW